MKEHLEIDLHRRCRKIAFDVEHALRLIENRSLGQLRAEDARHGQVHLARGKIGEDLAETRGGIDLTKARRCLVAQHREITGLNGIVQAIYKNNPMQSRFRAFRVRAQGTASSARIHLSVSPIYGILQEK